MKASSVTKKFLEERTSTWELTRPVAPEVLGLQTKSSQTYSLLAQWSKLIDNPRAIAMHLTLNCKL